LLFDSIDMNRRKPETEETKEIEEKQEEYPDSSDIDPDDLEVEGIPILKLPHF